MADGVTNIGDGWGIAAPGTAEAALEHLLAAGALTGDALCQELIAEGHGSRGPAYYPIDNGKGPFYALGEPHTYCSIEQGPNGPQWNLTDATNGVPIPITGSTSQPTPAPTPAPAPTTPSDADRVIAAMSTNTESIIATIGAVGNAQIARIAAAQEAIQQQIDQVVKNAENTMKAIEPIVEAALPALAGLFGKK